MNFETKVGVDPGERGSFWHPTITHGRDSDTTNVFLCQNPHGLPSSITLTGAYQHYGSCCHGFFDSLYSLTSTVAPKYCVICTYLFILPFLWSTHGLGGFTPCICQTDLPKDKKMQHIILNVNNLPDVTFNPNMFTYCLDMNKRNM